MNEVHARAPCLPAAIAAIQAEDLAYYMERETHSIYGKLPAGSIFHLHPGLQVCALCGELHRDILIIYNFSFLIHYNNISYEKMFSFFSFWNKPPSSQYYF